MSFSTKSAFKIKKTMRKQNPEKNFISAEKEQRRRGRREKIVQRHDFLRVRIGHSRARFFSSFFTLRSLRLYSPVGGEHRDHREEKEIFLFFSVFSVVSSEAGG
jgi:hypothetical protein